MQEELDVDKVDQGRRQYGTLKRTGVDVARLHGSDPEVWHGQGGPVRMCVKAEKFLTDLYDDRK